MFTDPILGRGGSNQELSKLAHNFRVDDRVRVKESGHRGKITQFENGKIDVLLDSGHSVNCDRDELEPHDWQDSPTAKLQRAIAAGRVSVHDQVTIQVALEKISTGSYAVDPIPLGDERIDYDSPFRILKLFAEKYADDGDVLNKRAEVREESGRMDDPVRIVVDALKRGEDVTLPTRVQHACMKHALMRKLIADGRIRFQETAFI